MPDLWMPGAERRPVGNTGAMNGGPPRATWHATSNDNDWTYAAESAYFGSGGAGVAPHLVWDPFTGQICQYFPANSRALALKNATGEQTNRTGSVNIQIEVVFTNNETVAGRRYANIADTPCKNLGQIMAWLRSFGIPDVWPGGAPKAWARQTVSLDTWRTRGGHYGHCHVPGNDHIDPGPMPALFGAIPTSPISSEDDDMPTPQEIATAVWNSYEKDPQGGDPIRTGAVMAWMDSVTVQSRELFQQQLAAAVAELKAAVTQPAPVQVDANAVAAALAANSAFIDAIANRAADVTAKRLEA